jgi:hypothetical protein
MKIPNRYVGINSNADFPEVNAVINITSSGIKIKKNPPNKAM